jgi:hypothetical protein
MDKNIHNSLWILKISRKSNANQKSWDFSQMFLISKNKARALWKKTNGFKNLWKIYSIACGFSFFVISISDYNALWKTGALWWWVAFISETIFTVYSSWPSGEFELLASIPTAPSAGLPALNIYIIFTFSINTLKLLLRGRCHRIWYKQILAKDYQKVF